MKLAPGYKTMLVDGREYIVETEDKGMSQPDWSKAPEGATHCWPFAPEFLKRDDGTWYVWYAKAKRWAVASIPSRLVDLVERPPEEWNGTGLPPVGTVCECSWDSGSGTYEKVKVVAHEDDLAVFKWLTGSRPGTYQAADACGLHGGRVPQFRPIRTPEQIAADEREAAIKEMAEVIKSQFSFGWVFEKLYDAGYRKP